MKKILCLILLLSGFAAANVYEYPANLNDIFTKMPKIESIKCKFKQEKHMQNIQKPLVSSGDFEFVENKGVYFHTKYPIQTENNYTNEKYKQINDIICAISKKKYSGLEKEFDFYFQGNSNNWSLGLKPKKATQAFNYIKSITLQGDDYIHQITIEQTNGNKTLLWFTK